MPNTYTQLYIQLVFTVKHRTSFIQPKWKDELYKYLTATIQNDGHKMLAINGMPDHIHLFIGLNPSIALSNVVRETKKTGNNFINQNQFTPGKFEWQEGYGAFSYSRSHISQVCRYIEMQEQHHAKTTFQTEYLAMLKAFKIAYKDEYVFQFYN